MIDKLIEKYKLRLLILKDNKGSNILEDTYPYDLDIETTEEFIKDLERLKEEPKYREFKP